MPSYRSCFSYSIFNSQISSSHYAR
ncbi:leader peptide SpeFL [Pasteurella multocida]|nr:leader peptide SpeFL [Pasteurella multocida]MCG5100530.1 leader peptide SpeFL [Pasteurella multocida subsp. multocida]MCG5124169.1 leader peptide SpeFL [Pasteurella multocida]MCH1907028.1 leader peptide SpeFL [Pasteurella multocida]MCH4803197.1 leader peptide SpeFL [Pasteurella multocida]MCL7757576.1 leader peptide SpeFL [Pasteurella multocida]